MIRWVVIFLLILAILGLTTAAYHYQAQRYALYDMPFLRPAIPFSEFPFTLGDWQGQDVPIRETVLKAAGNDDHLCRRYVQPDLGVSAMLYVGFTSEPRRMLGHRPDICYVNSGWTLDYIEKKKITSAAGKSYEVLLHRFVKPSSVEQLFVLNYYIVNGQHTTDHKTFEGLSWRRPKIAAGQPRYVAQTQISSENEAATLLLASQVVDIVQSYMPAAVNPSVK